MASAISPPLVAEALGNPRDADARQPVVTSGHADPIVDLMIGALAGRQLAQCALDVRRHLRGGGFSPATLHLPNRGREVSAPRPNLVTLFVQAHLNPVELAIRWRRRPVSQEVIGT